MVKYRYIDINSAQLSLLHQLRCAKLFCDTIAKPQTDPPQNWTGF